MTNQELINYTKQQVQYTKYFKEDDAVNGMYYWKNKFNELALKVLCLDNAVETVPIRKEGNPHTVRPWRVKRDEAIRQCYVELKKVGGKVDDNFIRRTAQDIGTTTPKVKSVISNIEFYAL